MSEKMKPAEHDPREEHPEDVQPVEELSEEEMDKIAGGTDRPNISEIVITKPVDSSSPKLFP